MEFRLEQMTEEEALSVLLEFMKGERKIQGDPFNDYGDDLYIPAVISAYLQQTYGAVGREQANRVGMSRSIYNHDENAGPFYAAAASLCRRGILHPSWGRLPKNVSQYPVLGAGFMLTSYGREWLAGLGDHAVTPTEHTQFERILLSHASRLGLGYKSRAIEALRCYQAQTYLSCCAMCGAASESILLALAITKTKDEGEVLKIYRSARGRSYLEGLLSAQQNSHVKEEIATYMGLLNYWRDEASHGTDTGIDEQEAFLALILLLRMAKFADDRWDTLTA